MYSAPHAPVPSGSSVSFVAPLRSRRARAPWVYPYDFFYALLRVWDVERLADFMRILNQAVHVLADDGRLCNTQFWQSHWLPVLLPAPAFHPVDCAFARLHAAASAGGSGTATADVVASMRLCALVAFVVDYRVRVVVMTPDARIHGRLGTRPPDAAAVWDFFTRGGGDAARNYVPDVVAIKRNATLAAAQDATIVALTHARLDQLVMLMLCPALPTPAPPTKEEEEEEVT